MVLPLTRKHARRILGHFIWSLRPTVGFAPFLSDWWAHCQWGPNWLQNCPLSLVQSLLHCLLLSYTAWKLQVLLPLNICVCGGVLYVDAAFDVNKFKVGVWGPTLRGRVFPCSPGVGTQQEAELEAPVRGVRLCIRVGWLVWRLIGDDSSALEQVASLRTSGGLRRQNRHLRRLSYLIQRLEGSVYLEYFPGDLNPADSVSRIDSECKGRMQDAYAGTADRHMALQSFPRVPSPVWDLGFPKGRRGVACNLDTAAMGSADPLS